MPLYKEKGHRKIYIVESPEDNFVISSEDYAVPLDRLEEAFGIPGEKILEVEKRFDPYVVEATAYPEGEDDMEPYFYDECIFMSPVEAEQAADALLELIPEEAEEE